MYTLNMKVYRIMHEKEYELLKAGDIENLGGYFYGLTLPNNHHYKKDVKYLHFFKNKTALDKYFRSTSFKKEGNFVMGTFSIPFRKLFLHSSYGKYLPSGYDFDYETEKEYALPIGDFKIEYFVSAEPINNEEEIEK